MQMRTGPEVAEKDKYQTLMDDIKIVANKERKLEILVLESRAKI